MIDQLDNGDYHVYDEMPDGSTLEHGNVGYDVPLDEIEKEYTRDDDPDPLGGSNGESPGGSSGGGQGPGSSDDSGNTGNPNAGNPSAGTSDGGGHGGSQGEGSTGDDAPGDDPSMGNDPEGQRATIKLRINSQKIPRVALAARVKAIYDREAAASQDRILQLTKDTREIHREIYGDFAPKNFPWFAGHYRGTSGTLLEDRTIWVRCFAQKGVRSRDAGVLPGKVADELAALENKVTDFCVNKEVDAMGALAEIFCNFVRIHPYWDGNGHVARLLIALLAREKGLRVHPDWLGSRRPYGNYISFCIQNFHSEPERLTNYLRNWLGNQDNRT